MRIKDDPVVEFSAASPRASPGEGSSSRNSALVAISSAMTPLMLHRVTKEIVVDDDRSVKLPLALIGTDDPAVAMQGHINLCTNDSGRHFEKKLYPAIDARVLVGSKK